MIMQLKCGMLLKTSKTNTIGIVLADKTGSGISHSHFSSVIESFKVTVEKYGYDIMFIGSKNGGDQKMTYYEHCLYRNVDGVLIACVDFYDPEVIELIQSYIPVVTIDHLFNNRVAVMSDNVIGMQDLVSYVCNQGHRKIAYIYGDDSAVSKSRLTSFYNTLESNNIEIPQDYVRRAGYRNLQLAAKRTAELLELKEPPTCILYPDDYAAIGGMNYVVNGERLERFGVEAGLGFESGVDNWTFSVGYDLGLRKDYHSHTRMLKAKYDF